jgi:hypothetical protein
MMPATNVILSWFLYVQTLLHVQYYLKYSIKQAPVAHGYIHS